MTLTNPAVLTIGALARHFNCPAWQVRRLFERGFLPPATRVCPYRVVSASDLPTVKLALQDAGYLHAKEETVRASMTDYADRELQALTGMPAD
jgi:DNA-binding transcriptional MerR regulator